jgi:hypothetical protein
LPQVSAAARATVSAASGGGLPGLRALSRSSPSVHPLLGKTLLPSPDHRTADAELGRDLLHRAHVLPMRGHLRSLDVLVLTVRVRDDRRQPLAVRRAKDDAY